MYQMARPRLISEEIIIDAAKSYIEDVCKGNIKKFKYVQLADYISRKNKVSVKEYQVRRCKALVEFIAAAKQQKNEEKRNQVLIYENLNIENFLKNNNTTAKLKNALLQRDMYYKSLYEYLIEILDTNKKLEQKLNKVSEELEHMKGEQSALDDSVNIQNLKLQESEEKIKILQNILNTHVYPEIANKLLEEKGFFKLNASPVSEQGMENVIRAKDNITEFNDKVSDNALIQSLFDSI